MPISLFHWPAYSANLVVVHFMAAHEDNMIAILREYDLTAGLVVASDGETLSRVGDIREADCEGLMSALIGPFGDARVTFDSLDGQFLPRVWNQGRASRSSTSRRTSLW
jgi:hypothetical protein